MGRHLKDSRMTKSRWVCIAAGLLVLSLLSLPSFATEPAADSPEAKTVKHTAAEPLPLMVAIYIFVLASFLGYQLITRVPPLLHTPLMSGTNAISGISLVGSIVAAGGDYTTVSTTLGFVAVASSMCNVVGGFMITDRMLKMFKKDSK